MKSAAAVDAASLLTRADSSTTMPSWAMTSAQKTGRLVAMVRTRLGEEATDERRRRGDAEPDEHPSVDRAQERADVLGGG